MDFHLGRLHILNFRNHKDAELELGPQVNCFVGSNGTGKTNLLDTVHYLSLTKSYFDPIDMHNIQHGEDQFMVQGTLQTANGQDTILCSVRKGHRKVFNRNRKEYERLADHIGRYPVVMVTPYDGQLVLDGSEVRRKFIDGLIAQFDKTYLDSLIRYNRALVQRNTMLKQYALDGRGSSEMLEPWDEQLVNHGSVVFEVRKGFMKEMVPLLESHYQGISSGPEKVALTYRSALLETSMRELLRNSLHKDRAAQYTTVGIHRDELLFTINDQPLKRYGSQGQQKTYLIALKLAQFDLTQARSGLRPILLLDDIFDKIDPQRMRHLLKLLSDRKFGQVFITDTDATRLHTALDGLDLDVRFFHLAHDKPIRSEKVERTVA
ncbi:MAG: DNA replication/repair protein RecF [Flavobacteriales bacterium]|nr:DNA replication/repair protein RecF [Flavobacteriales bacterium]